MQIFKLYRVALIAFSFALLLAASQASAQDTYVLAANRQAGDLTRVTALLEVGGDLKVVNDGVVKPLKMSVVGNMAYDELIFTAEKEAVSSLRYYDRAEAVIKIERGGATPKLPEDRRLIGADWGSGGMTLFSPEGPLTREQLDLIELPASSLVVDALLPEEPVAVGGKWKHSEPLLAILLDLDAVSSGEVESELKEAKSGQTALIEMAGTVSGAVSGVSTKIEIKGRYQFDFKQRRITHLTLLIKEDRSIGHVATGLDAVSKLTLTMAPLTESRHLTPEIQESVTLDPNPQSNPLVYDSTAGEFRLVHDRRWHAINDDKLLTLRLVDRGDLIAQCNVSALAKVGPGERVTLAKFQSDIQQALGNKFERFVKASQGTDERGYVRYSVQAVGTVAELPIQWNYYLVSDDQGRQVVFAFTLEEALVERFADADAVLVGMLDFLEPATASQNSILKSTR